MLQRSNKEALKLAWGFFKGNYALNFAAIAILIVLNLLGMIPVIGILFVFAYSLLSLSVQVYFAKAIERIESEDEIEDIAANTKIAQLFGEYVHVAAGAFLALFLLSFVFVLLLALVIMQGSFDVESLQNGVEAKIAMQTMVSASGIEALILLLIFAFLFYFFPAMMGRVLRSEDFVSAFKNVFLLFNPSFWKRCFNKSYFVLIFLWSLIIIGIAIVLIAMSATIILLPLVLVAAYIVSLYNSAIYIFADDLAKEGV